MSIMEDRIAGVEEKFSKVETEVRKSKNRRTFNKEEDILNKTEINIQEKITENIENKNRRKIWKKRQRTF